jgi:cell division protein ZipA
MMHNAARKIADEFDAQVYDGKRALLTKQSLQQYVERIREFERQRMLQR